MKRTDAIVYLRNFGHLRSEIPHNVLSSEDAAAEWLETSQEAADAVTDFQRTFGATTVDGVLGEPTLRAMLAPRCGCTPENMTAAQRGRSGLAQWPDRDWKSDPLTYGWKSFVRAISPDDQRGLAADACKHLAEVCGLIAREAKKGERIDVTIEAASGRGAGFDGPSGTLAMALVAGGRMWFDDQENWTVDRSGRGISYQNVFAHEFGHVAGLGHSSIKSALMAPFYSVNVWRLQSPDDIEQLQARYGKPAEVPSEPPPTDAAGSKWILSSDTDRRKVFTRAEG